MDSKLGRLLASDGKPSIGPKNHVTSNRTWVTAVFETRGVTVALVSHNPTTAAASSPSSNNKDASLLIASSVLVLLPTVPLLVLLIFFALLLLLFAVFRVYGFLSFCFPA